MNEGMSELDELIKKEWGKYNLPISELEKEKINMESFDTIIASIKYLAATKIGPALSSIIFDAVHSLQGKGIEIRKNTFIRADQLRECILRDRDPEIQKIKIKVNYDTKEDVWSLTEVELDNENLISIRGKYSNPENAEGVRIITSEKTKKVFPIILKEEEKIKETRLNKSLFYLKIKNRRDYLSAAFFISSILSIT
jgi:hypothetical protein